MKKNPLVFTLSALGVLVAVAGMPRPAAADGDASQKPPEVHAGGEMSHNQKPKPKPRPKRPDKDKDCQFDRSEELTVESKTVTISQDTIKNIMSGREAEQDGYNFYAETALLVLHVRDPEGNWYTANMTRLGSEGCIFYYIGELVPQNSEPPL